MASIFNWLGRRPDKRFDGERKSAGNFIALHCGLEANWPTFGTGAGARKGFCENPIVYRCVSLIAGAASTVPLQVCEDGVDCDEHPLLELLQRPNQKQSSSKLFEALYGHLLLSGNAFLVRVAIEGKIRELHVLDPEKVSPVAGEQGWPIAYQYESDGRYTTYGADEDVREILPLSLFNPASDTDGLSPVASARMALEIHNAASIWNKALLDNSARPSGALVYAPASGENLSQEQFERLKSELETGYTGATTAGRPMVLEGGLDWKAMAYSPRDMDFLEAKNGAAREIALALGVPPMLLGIPGDNTYSNYQEANRALWRETVLPLVERTVEEISHWASDQYDKSMKLMPNRDVIPALANERDALWNRIAQADFLTPDEKREALGFAPLEVADDV